MNMQAVKYKLKFLRNRFYDAGDDAGVMMCDNLAEDLDINFVPDQQEPESQDEQE